MQLVRVNLGSRGYDIALSTGQPAGIGAFVRERMPHSRLALVVCDANTRPHAEAVQASLQEHGFRTGLAAIPAGEISKTLAEAAKLYDALYEHAADRKTAVVAVGG